MPELRYDEITDGLVIIASDRAARPDTFRVEPPSLPASLDTCPFCPGNEAMTPPEVSRTGSGAPDAPGWRVRVVPNLYPIVGTDGPEPGAEGTRGGDVAIRGAHEVAVLSPAHHRSFGLLSDDEAVELLAVMRNRVAHHLDAGLAHAQVFVNHGRTAGASIEHPHAQLVALDFVPPEVAGEQRRLGAARQDLVAAALAAGRTAELSVVDGPAVVWCPRASASPFEMMVAHRSTRARFDEARDAEVAVVARATREALARLRGAVGDVAYNVTVHTAPREAPPGGHWFVRITPRVTVTAGFEQATGVLVNVVPPEAAAAALRAAPSEAHP